MKAGTQYNNIVAEHAEINFTRNFGPEVRKFTNDRVIRIAKQTAMLYSARGK